MLGIVGIVVDGSHGTHQVKAFCEHSLGIKISESERSLQTVHATFLTPGRYGIKQCTAYVYVINEINPAEPYGIDLPRLIGLTVDDGGHAAHHLTVLNGNEGLRLAEIKCCITLRPERVLGIADKIRYGIGVIPVKLHIETCKPAQVPGRLDRDYGYVLN